jgi:hypothetical protein
VALLARRRVCHRRQRRNDQHCEYCYGSRIMENQSFLQEIAFVNEATVNWTFGDNSIYAAAFLHDIFPQTAPAYVGDKQLFQDLLTSLSQTAPPFLLQPGGTLSRSRYLLIFSHVRKILLCYHYELSALSTYYCKITSSLAWEVAV